MENHRLNVRVKTVKLSEEKREGNLSVCRSSRGGWSPVGEGGEELGITEVSRGVKFNLFVKSIL